MTKRKMTQQERDDKVERYIDSALDGVSYSDLHDIVCEDIRNSFADVSDEELNAHIDDHFGEDEPINLKSPMTVYVVEIFTDLCGDNEVHLFDTYEKALACWNMWYSNAVDGFFPDGLPPKEEIQKMIDDPLKELYEWDVEDKYKFLDGYPDNSRTFLCLSERQVL